MHARRRWTDAAALLPKEAWDSENAEELPEIKALKLIGVIYADEKKVKGMSAEGRYKVRKTTTAVSVDAYFAFIKSLDQTSPVLSERACDAVKYSLNQEEYLRRFLEDGHLSCDNGHSEKLIKPLALGRRNWLFSNTLESARASCIIYSLAQTAILHKTDTYYYFKYLLEKMPTIMEGADIHGNLPATAETKERLSQMMPWSEAYRSYERMEKEKRLTFLELSEHQKPPELSKKRHSNRQLLAG